MRQQRLQGPLGLHELLVATDAVKKLIQEHARVAEMLATALEEGMRTLKQDGMEKVMQGSHRHGAGARGLHQVARDGTRKQRKVERP